MSAQSETTHGGPQARARSGDCAPATFDPTPYDPALVARAGRVWQERVHSEYRSLQIVTRFLTELTEAGEPIRWHAGAADLITDEARHVGLCWDLCHALGASPALPDPPQLQDPPEFLAAPPVQRALATALTMLVVNETLSVAWLTDLAARSRDPAVGAVLRATVEDEAEHDHYGLDYARWSLARFASRVPWRALVARALERHHTWAATVPDGPDAPDEAALGDLGLFSPTRQARIYRQTWQTVLGPRLVDLGLI